jgi:hypothetical protein
VTSAFGWLDTDSDQRRTMLEVVDLFKEQGTVDDLGIGTIRDALSDAMFPGTSVLHTRLRYVLFVPWLLQRASRHTSPTEMSVEFRRLELTLIESLLRGGEVQGVIGNRARSSLKTPPSQAYWASLGAWGILTSPTSPEGYFRRQHDYRELARRTAQADDVEARDLLPSTGIDPYLPRAPDHLMTRAVLALTGDEEQYLSDHIARSTEGTAFSWLVNNAPSTLTNDVWDLDNLDKAPARIREVVDHARRFHTAIYGAPLLYNLLLAQRAESDELVAAYRDALEDWQDEVAATSALDGWDRSAWWDTVRTTRPQLRPATRTFVDTWLDRISAGTAVADDPHLCTLVANRERQIKGARARLVNQSALDRWNGESGLARLDFRWRVARSHLQDLYDARELA